jgi:hypothetical protein
MSVFVICAIIVAILALIFLGCLAGERTTRKVVTLAALIEAAKINFMSSLFFTSLWLVLLIAAGALSAGTTAILISVGSFFAMCWTTGTLCGMFLEFLMIEMKIQSPAYVYRAMQITHKVYKAWDDLKKFFASKKPVRSGTKKGGFLTYKDGVYQPA